MRFILPRGFNDEQLTARYVRSSIAHVSQLTNAKENDKLHN